MEINQKIPDWLWACLRIAFLGEIYTNIRAIAISYDNKIIGLRYYLDREVLDYDYESLEVVSTNLDSIIPISLEGLDIECFFTEELIKDVNPLDGFFYVRREYN